jgi:hypothetical protein
MYLCIRKIVNLMTSIELDMIQTASIGAMFADLINTGIVTLFLNLM